MKAIIAQIDTEFESGYPATNFDLCFKRGDRLYPESNPYSQSMAKTWGWRTILAITELEELVGYPYAHKVNNLSGAELAARELFESTARVYAKQKYELPYLMDMKAERDWGWISPQGIYYSNGYARHTATASAICVAMGYEFVSEQQLIEKHYVRVTPFSFETVAPMIATPSQMAIMRRLVERWERVHGHNSMRLDSFKQATGVPYA